MPEQRPQPPVIDYAAPQPRRPWLTGWAWTLLVLVTLTAIVWPSTRRTSSRGLVPEIIVLTYLPIAVRAGWGAIQRDRSRWWIAYLLLIFALPLIAGAVVEFHDTTLGARIGSAMYHFWRDLF